MKKPTRTCTIDGCERPYLARGMCSMHWKRAKKSGTLATAPRTYHYNPEEAFAARTEWRGDCLIWIGAVDAKGYGRIWVEGKHQPAHRFAWEQENGDLPTGMVVDHINHCNPACCNPEHLRPATVAENTYNRAGANPDNKSSGIRNVHRNGDRWKVQVRKEGHYHYFGTYATIPEAAAVAERARRELFGDFAGSGRRIWPPESDDE